MSPDANHHTSSTAHPIKRMGSGWSLGYRWRSTLRSSLSLYDSHSCSIKIYPSLPFLGWKWFSFWGTIFCLFSRSELEVRLEHAEKDLTMMDERIKFLRAEKSDQLTMVDDLHAELGKCFGPQNHHCKRDSNSGLASVTTSLVATKVPLPDLAYLIFWSHWMKLRVSCICLFIGLWYGIPLPYLCL